MIKQRNDPEGEGVHETYSSNLGTKWNRAGPINVQIRVRGNLHSIHHADMGIGPFICYIM